MTNHPNKQPFFCIEGAEIVAIDTEKGTITTRIPKHFQEHLINQLPKSVDPVQQTSHSLPYGSPIQQSPVTLQSPSQYGPSSPPTTTNHIFTQQNLDPSQFLYPSS
eukprot:TRINITY_DN17522_c0_g1_i1.p1 TRINITY_DN17522_c0_g1~~TRINITY_DN17522_c0_g1_i1.p1  ORF type:complete len:106 (+),score=22.70 TRINITY_DN17522_c0_g1_i1:178-495(+)